MINGKAYCSVLLILVGCKSVVATLSKGWDEAVLLPRLQWWLYLISSAAHQQHRHGGKAPSEWLGNIHSSHGKSACYCSQSYDSGRHQVELLQSCFSFDSFDVMGWSRYIYLCGTGLIYPKRPFLSSWIKLQIQSQLVNLLFKVNQSWHMNTREPLNKVSVSLLVDKYHDANDCQILRFPEGRLHFKLSDRRCRQKAQQSPHL